MTTWAALTIFVSGATIFVASLAYVVLFLKNRRIMRYLMEHQQLFLTRVSFATSDEAIQEALNELNEVLSLEQHPSKIAKGTRELSIANNLIFLGDEFA